MTTIPNPLDLQAWSPANPAHARASLGLPLDANLILFGAEGRIQSPIKGMDLLLDSMHHLAAHTTEHAKPIELVVFGGDKRSVGTHPSGLRVHHLGTIRNDHILRLCYSATDVMVVPSRQDNLPQTAVEAQACGTPVVAFRVGGLPEIVEDGQTGRLAEPFDTAAMAEAIAWVLDDPQRLHNLGLQARIRTEAHFDSERIASEYAAVYREAYHAQGEGRTSVSTSG